MKRKSTFEITNKMDTREIYYIFYIMWLICISLFIKLAILIYFTYIYPVTPFVKYMSQHYLRYTYTLYIYLYVYEFIWQRLVNLELKKRCCLSEQHVRPLEENNFFSTFCWSQKLMTRMENNHHNEKLILNLFSTFYYR